MTTGAEIIAARLYNEGCRHAFGIPGGEVLTLIDALDRAGIRFGLCKHENGGGFMAEGTYHATGAPAVLVATIGPGVANLANVVANAFQERVPMIVITGCVDAAEAATYTHQVFDHRALLDPITKASFTVVDGAVDVIIDKAIAVATDGQPGPVHVDLPIAIAGLTSGGSGAVLRPKNAPSSPASGPELDAARAAISGAKRLLVIAGVDAMNQNAGAALSEFVTKYNVPLITTYKAKGIVPETNPVVLGGAGLSPKADDILLPLVRQADVIILAGYDPIEMRVGWRNPWHDGAMVIDLCAVPNTHYVHQAQISFVCDISSGLRALSDGIDMGRLWENGAIEQVRTAQQAVFPIDEDWGPAAIIDTIWHAVPRGTVATVDTGAHRILLSQMWKCAGARGLLQSSALCTMGCALPLAIGQSLASDNAPVIAFTGDAGLEMVLGELATARDLAVPIIVVVFIDQSLGLIEMKQRSSGFANLAVDFGGSDFVGIANAMGGVGVNVTDRGALRDAINDALTRDNYTLITCPIGRKAYDGRI